MVVSTDLGEGEDVSVMHGGEAFAGERKGERSVKEDDLERETEREREREREGERVREGR